MCVYVWARVYVCGCCLQRLNCCSTLLSLLSQSFCFMFDSTTLLCWHVSGAHWPQWVSRGSTLFYIVINSSSFIYYLWPWGWRVGFMEVHIDFWTLICILLLSLSSVVSALSPYDFFTVSLLPVGNIFSAHWIFFWVGLRSQLPKCSDLLFPSTHRQQCTPHPQHFFFAPCPSHTIGPPAG